MQHVINTVDVLAIMKTLEGQDNMKDNVFVSLVCKQCKHPSLYIKTQNNNNRKYCSKECQVKYYRMS